ncbi:ribonuclease H, partial [Trifolium pratense]
MMTSIIPKACVDEIQKMQRRFIWGDTEHSRKYHAIGWDIMTKPKDCGGLGLRRLTVMNKACILKLGRKLQTGSQEFWCNVMWGKYRRGSTNNNVVAKTLDSHLWKSIVKLWPKLDELCFWTIRDGKSVDCYWYSQVWIEEGLRVADLNLNIPDSLRDLKVTQLVDDEGRWKLEVLAACLPVSLLHMIAAIPPPEESAGADSAYCMEDTAGNFSISAMYHPLYRFDDSNGSAMCDFCGDQVETILHVMRDCPLVMPLWLNLVHSNMRRNFFTGNTQQWIEFNLNVDVREQFDVECKSIWAISCHFAWSWRNKEKHEVNFIRPTAPAMVVMNAVRSYVVADRVLHIGKESRKVEKLITWKPPPVGWVRLNTDGAHSEDGSIGCGGIIRGSDGEWLGGFA